MLVKFFQAMHCVHKKNKCFLDTFIGWHWSEGEGEGLQRMLIEEKVGRARRSSSDCAE